MKTTQTLAEKYRPKSWGEIVAQPEAVFRLRLLANRGGLAGRAFWISGASGTGKTSLARLIADDIAGALCITELDAGMMTPTKLAELEAEQFLTGMDATKPGRAYIVNEAHGLKKQAIRQLLVMLERLPAHVSWIFTTTGDGQAELFEDCSDASPLTSRCTVINLKSDDSTAAAFAKHLHGIAEAEGLNGSPEADYLALVQKHKNNLRACLQAVESGELLFTTATAAADASTAACGGGAARRGIAFRPSGLPADLIVK